MGDSDVTETVEVSLHGEVPTPEVPTRCGCGANAVALFYGNTALTLAHDPDQLELPL
jgi:hypothetical protein